MATISDWQSKMCIIKLKFYLFLISKTNNIYKAWLLTVKMMND